MYDTIVGSSGNTAPFIETKDKKLARNVIIIFIISLSYCRQHAAGRLDSFPLNTTPKYDSWPYTYTQLYPKHTECRLHLQSSIIIQVGVREESCKVPTVDNLNIK